MTDNLDPQSGDNLDQGAGEGTEVDTSSATEVFQEGAFSWKENLNPDLKNAPFMQKFDDSKEGLGKAMESYGNLEKLLGHEKVPIPKGDDDVEGWTRFSKAMGIPSKSEGYGLPNMELPEEIKGSALNKERFAEIAHAHKLTPSQASGLWKLYNEIGIENYNKAMSEYEKSMGETVSRLKGEWGDTYETNIELGQMVINKFSSDEEMSNYLTAVLSKDPRGIKFLAKIGDQFAENKVGEFQMKRFSKAPEEAMEEINKIRNDMNHPYNNSKATAKEHDAAVDYVNNLYKIANKANG